ncbi:MAG TPA: helicase-related protein, partial [Patescibacteria group bacterium]
TWLVPQSKRPDSLHWIAEQVRPTADEKRLALVVCPFIDPSASEALENVSAATETYEKVKTQLQATGHQLNVGLLHGRLKPKEKEQVIADLYSQQIDVLVTTPIVEVGVDLPTADIIVIEAAERFGLASLHQLRGRVGRAGQQAYCLLFTTKPSEQEKERLTVFTQETNGIKLAEFDLKNRGAGNIFGTQQHGFDTLKYADWANLQLITKARQTYDQVKTNPNWQPFIEVSADENHLPAAN